MIKCFFQFENPIDSLLLHKYKSEKLKTLLIIETENENEVTKYVGWLYK